MKAKRLAGCGDHSFRQEGMTSESPRGSLSGLGIIKHAVSSGVPEILNDMQAGACAVCAGLTLWQRTYQVTEVYERVL